MSFMVVRLTKCYSREIKSQRIRSAKHVVHVAGKQECLKDFGLETWRKDPLGIPTRKWECKIKTDLKEMEQEDMNLIPLSQNKANWTFFFLDTLMKFWVTWKAGDFLTD